MIENELRPLLALLDRTTRVTVLTGSGISAESGIPTFRGAQGLWKQFRAEELATPEAFEQNPKLVWEWYDWRRGIIGRAEPNEGHRTISAWQEIFANFSLITQNIDGLHERAGSREPIELHGNIWKLRCLREGTVTESREVPLRSLPPLCPSCGAMLRPHVVWFGEALERSVLDEALRRSASSEVMFVVGTSAIVHPAASLPLTAADSGAKIVEVNPEPTPLSRTASFVFRGKAGEILPAIQQELIKKLRS
jgi:NAD-dependent deacetylase